MQANAWVDVGTLHSKALFGDPESEEPTKRTHALDNPRARSTNTYSLRMGNIMWVPGS